MFGLNYEQIKDKDSEWNKITCMLAKHAEYAKIGGNKTGGYGVTRLTLDSQT